MALGRGLGALIPNFNAPPSQSSDGTRAGGAPTTQSGEVRVQSKENQVWYVPVSLIRANAYQPRQRFDHADLEDLINSIKEHGVIQPLLLTELKDGNYELIAGERRLRAAKIAGLSTVPAIVKEVKGSQKLELALIENIQRQNLNPLEEAFAFERLIKEFGLTQEEVSRRVGKSRPYVANTLRLLNLPEEIKEAIMKGSLSVTAARAILGLENAKEQLKLYNQLMKEKNSVREVEDKVSAARLKANLPGRRDPLVLDYEARLREALGTKVKITKTGGKGSIIIDYYSDEELARIIKKISE